ncbi:unnamed protein product [Cylindrotheca closterium]|uniref:U-box domain-containing protein n=1 Tax=Cylindrotheca closterium TaxID=2856 RepID=A0AAD2FXG4_9STRA|nr:unnamed protein product [Cylindrotheca closterium]
MSRPTDIMSTITEVSFSNDSSENSENEGLIPEVLMKGLSLSQVTEIYKDRLSEDNVVAIARRLLIEIGSKHEQKGQVDTDDWDDDSEASLGNGRINRNQHFCSIGIDILRRSPCDLLTGSELLKHHIANLSQSAPEEFLDPISFDIMHDPVVISSGFVVDRSTAINQSSGELQLATCPWSRVELSPELYPALRLKQKMTEFKSGRVDEMIETASLLLNAKNERDFCKVFELAQEFMDDIGPNGHRELAVQLAELVLSTLTLKPSDPSRLCILQPSVLTKHFLMLHSLKQATLVQAYLPIKAFQMSEMVQKAIGGNQFDEAEKWLACCTEIQDKCEDLLTGNKEIPLGKLHLDLAEKRGGNHLEVFVNRFTNIEMAFILRSWGFAQETIDEMTRCARVYVIRDILIVNCSDKNLERVFKTRLAEACDLTDVARRIFAVD